MSEGYAQRGDPACVYGVRRLDQSEFIGAHLKGTNSPGASLREADLTDASLRRNLRDAEARAGEHGTEDAGRHAGSGRTKQECSDARQSKGGRAWSGN